MSRNTVSSGIILLIRMLRDKVPMSTLHDNNVVPEAMFLPPELKLYKYITLFQGKHGVPPSLAVTLNQGAFQQYRNLRLPTDPITSFMEMVVQRSALKTLHEARDELDACLFQGDIAAATDLFVDTGRKLTKITSTTASVNRDKVIPIYAAMDNAIALHNERRDAYGIQGMSLGLPYVDYVTDGVYDGQFAAIVARPGMGKTYFALNAGMNSWLQHRKPGMIVSFEMPASQLGRRCIGIGKQMNSDLLKKGRVSSMYLKEISKWVTDLRSYHNEVPLHIVQGSMDTSLAFIEDLVYEHKPAWILIDAAYLMRARRGRGQVSRSDNVADGAEGIRQLCLSTGVQGLATYQYNRKGAGTLDNIMYSDTIGQVASLVFDIQEDKKKSARWAGVASRVFTILKGRDGESGSVRVLFDPKRSRIAQAEVLFDSASGLSKQQLAEMSSGYGEFLSTYADNEFLLEMEKSTDDVFTFVPSKSTM